MLFRLDGASPALLKMCLSRMKARRNIVFLAILLLFSRIAAAAAEPQQAVISRIKREPVVSSNVASVGYSRRLHALEIEFARGAVYRFLDVPPGVYRGLLGAGSKGHFIAENLRGKYDFG